MDPNQVKSEHGNQTRHKNQSTSTVVFHKVVLIGIDPFAAIEVETYIAEQKARPDEDRYIHVSERERRTAIFGIKHGIVNYIHEVRTLDCDTTFMPVAGKSNLYEIDGWMSGINKGISSSKPSPMLFFFIMSQR
jgi:hypothetical protein